MFHPNVKDIYILGQIYLNKNKIKFLLNRGSLYSNKPNFPRIERVNGPFFKRLTQLSHPKIE